MILTKIIQIVNLVKDNSLKFELFYSAGQPLTSIAFHESGQMLRLDLT